MAWVYLFIAGLLEIVWAVGLKQSEGFSKFWPSVWTILGMIVSFWFLAAAARTLPLGTAYAVWTGIGVVGTSIFGIVYFGEPMTWVRIVCLLFILTGIIGLKAITLAAGANPAS